MLATKRPSTNRAAYLFMPFLDGYSKALFAFLPLISYAYFRELVKNWPNLTTFDLFVFAYNPSIGLPLIWFICPIVTMIILARIWGERASYNIICRMGTRTRIWSTHFIDILIIAFFCSVIVHISLFFIGLVFIDIPFVTSDQTSIFARFTGGQTLESFSPFSTFAIMLLYSFFVLVFVNSCFMLLYFISSALPAFILISLLNFPSVHKTHAIVHDIVSGYGGDLLAVNPLSYLYETASVFYPSWLPGQTHMIWFLVLMIGISLFLGWLAVQRKQYVKVQSS